MRALTGYGAEEFLRSDGVTVSSITVEEDLPRVIAEVREAIEGHDVFKLRYRIRHADGSIRWVHDRGHAVYDQEGRARSLTGVIIDITERIAAEESVRTSQARLLEAQRIARIGSSRARCG